MKKSLFLILSLMASVFVVGQNHWIPDESIYANTMSVNAVVAFNDIEQVNENYEVGVFCDDELRGSQKTMYVPDMDRYMFFITVYGNDNDKLTFRLYDHKAQQELNYPTSTILVFETNDEAGSVGSPFVINYETSNGNHWNPDEGMYDATMNIIAVPAFNGDELRSENYEIGAFCNEEVRGSGRTQYIPDFDKYFVFLTVYGKDKDVITFKIYDHEQNMELDYSTEAQVTFLADEVEGAMDNPFLIDFVTPIKIYTFVGDGSWNEASNWKNNKMPSLETDNVVIDGNAYLSSEAVITSLVINENMSLTIEDGGLLEVKEEFSNTDFDALIINDGGQLIQSNEGVAATFKKNIVNPTGQWGEEDNTGWQFISSPMINSLVSDFIPEYGDYDLYKYDGTLEKQWYNYKYSVNYDFDETEQDYWYSIDADGDGYNWWMIEGELCSFSYDEGSGNPLKPDNYLVFPKIMIEDGMCFDFSVRAGDVEYPEFCGVAVSDDGTTFEMINDGWIIDNSEWEKKSVCLDDYVGQELFVAIRHYNVTDAYCLLVDNVSLNLESASLENGLSYLVSYESDNTAEFKGILNNKDLCTIKTNYSSTDNMVNYNLVGNPFSYNLNWATDVELVGISEGYAIIQNNGAYEYKTDGIIKVGCGVMLHSSMLRNHNITMKKGIKQSKRNVDASINIFASNNEGSDNVIIRFDEENLSYFPKLANFNDRIANVYVKENDTVYGIYTYKAEVNEIPVHFEVKEMGAYTLTFDVDGDYENLYLIDKMTGEKIDLLVENEYSFIANSNDNTERFIIKMDNSQQTTGNSHFVYVSGEELIIDAEGTIQIVDMMGRVVYSNDVTIDNNRIDVSDLNKAAYVVRVINEKGVNVQKIIL
ncbi:MAG: choice-of-anchor J domain-containing protein [Bacteroidales bacterium]|nr:choice-of-anchor J domain-containing protein [Bacteroidales bacterium]